MYLLSEKDSYFNLYALSTKTFRTRHFSMSEAGTREQIPGIFHPLTLFYNPHAKPWADDGTVLYCTGHGTTGAPTPHKRPVQFRVDLRLV